MMTATECPSADQLKAFTLGCLSEEDSDVLFQHLRDCERCKAELETVDSEDSFVHGLRQHDDHPGLTDEPDCRMAMAKALAALADAGEGLADSEEDDLPSSIGEYDLVRRIGRGGMGCVYLARHTKLGREVALKVLGGHRLADRRMRDRFDVEMRAVGRLSHPNIVTAHDAREIDGTAVLVTEYIDGLDLGQLVTRIGPLPIADACEITRVVATALQYTSDQGFVHRDVKPSNVMLSRQGDVKLLDLGLARFQFASAGEPEITGTGQTLGTADYIAPEQVVDGRSVDCRSDLYSLGCTLFKLLTGVAPFADPDHPTVFSKLNAHVSSPPPSLAERLPEAPKPLVKLVDSMLAKDPQGRPQSPGEVAEALVRFSRGADLVALIDRAVKMDRPAEQVAASSVSPRLQPWHRRRVPIAAAIGAGMLGLLAGLAMGLWIKITYPDGTTVKLPASGAHVEMVQDDAPIADQSGKETAVERAAATPAGAPSADKLPDANDSDGILGALSFAIIADPFNTDTKAAEAALREALKASDGFDQMVGKPSNTPRVVETPHGTWVPLASSVLLSEAVSVDVDGQPYGLIKNPARDGVTWPEIKGQILRYQDQYQGIELKFTPPVGEKLRRLTSDHLNQTLAIIADGKILAAPRILSAVAASVQITGDFTHEERARLREGLSAGLVEGAVRPPLSGSSLESMQDAAQARARRLATVRRLQGMWLPDPKLNRDTHDRLTSVIVIEKDQFFLINPMLTPPNNFATGDYQVRDLGEDRFELELKHAERGTAVFDATWDDQGLHLTYEVEESVFPGLQQNAWAGRGIPGRPQVWHLTKSNAIFAGELSEALNVKGAEHSPERIALALIDQFKRGGESSLPGKQTMTQSLIDVSLSMGRLKQIGLAFHNFYRAHRFLPASKNLPKTASEKTGKKYPYSWRVALLPYLDQGELWGSYRFDQPWDSEHNSKLIEQMPDVYRSPRAEPGERAGHTHFLGFASDVGALGKAGGRSFIELTDGTSKTVLLIESPSSVPWTKPEDLDAMVTDLYQPTLYLMADGSVGQEEKLNVDRFRKMITIAGGESIEDE
ncbi:protein kinase [Roseiconus nitratireducens]|uniref:Protein kinase n=1 Tax=Roseiconus nitratireducens TaxID=2605748 RepID=A0A5M6DGZ0_9BACT|nr:protein kinase [Roseiconus nitratireducens]KAA5544515.1 protein kinase [Roseiconus nitratireducens]